jgi:hypothetical protein
MGETKCESEGKLRKTNCLLRWHFRGVRAGGDGEPACSGEQLKDASDLDFCRVPGPLSPSVGPQLVRLWRLLLIQLCHDTVV